MGAIVIKSDMIMKKVSGNEAYVLFASEPEDRSLRDTSLYLSTDKYEAMGRPDLLTVTVRPGDFLNADPLEGEAL